MSSKHHSPNDQRSIVMNPNNPAYEADQRNREAQRDTQRHDESRREQPRAPAPKK